MIWVFKEHVVSSESVNHTCMWIVGGHIYPGCRLCATLWKRAGFLECSSCMVSCGHPSALYLFCLIPALQHWQLSHQTMNTPPQTQEPSRQPYTSASSLLGKETRKHRFLISGSQPSTTASLKGVGWALPPARQHQHRVLGKDQNRRRGEPDHPVTPGHHSLGRGWSVSLLCERQPYRSQGETSSLSLIPSTHNTTRKSLLWATPDTPLSQPRGLPPHLPSFFSQSFSCRHRLSTFTPHTSLTLQAQLCFQVLNHRPFLHTALLREDDLPRCSHLRGAGRRRLPV